jgi:hypothetical protein
VLRPRRNGGWNNLIQTKGLRIDRLRIDMTGTRSAVGLTVSLGALVGVAETSIRWTLTTTSVAATLIQIGLVVWLSRSAKRRLSVCSLFAILWVPYYTLRLIAISGNRTSPFYFAAVRQVSDARLIWYWWLTTAALACFAVGTACSLRIRGRLPTVNEAVHDYALFLALAAGGVALSAAVAFFHVSSGLLTAVSAISLFGIAGSAYEERKTGRAPRLGGAGWSVFPLLCAVGVGYASGLKENALMPIAAWLIGRTAAGHRYHLRTLVFGGAAFLVIYATVQGGRDAAQYDQPASNPLVAAQDGFTKFDLTYGVPSEHRGLSALANVANGVLFRLKGADYFLAIGEQVPSSVAFQHGASLWQPAASVVPGHRELFNLAPAFSHLSLGRYVTSTFISGTRPDPSSQSMTFLGDFYLNFGVIGVLVGMFTLGLLYALFDRIVTLNGPTSAAVFAMSGVSLLAMDRNVAYVLVTSLLAVASTAVLVGLIHGRSLILQSRTSIAINAPA